MAHVLVVTGEDMVSVRNEAYKIASRFREEGHTAKVVWYDKPFKPPKADLLIYWTPLMSNFVVKLPLWHHRSRCKRLVYYMVMEGVNRAVSWYRGFLKYHYLITATEFSKRMINASGFEVKDIIPHQFNLPLTVDHEYGRVWRAKFPAKKKVIVSNAMNIVKKGLPTLRKAVDLLSKKRNDFVCVMHSTDFEGYGWIPLKELEGVNTVIEPEFGLLSSEQVYAKMSYADIVVHSSYVESFGLPVPEALALGKPLVCANANGVNEIATPENSFMVMDTWEKDFEWCDKVTFKMSMYKPEDLAEQLELALDASEKEQEYKRMKGLEALKRLENSYDAFLEFLP